MLTCSVCRNKTNSIINIHKKEGNRTRIHRLCEECYVAYSQHKLNLSESPKHLGVNEEDEDLDEDEEDDESNY